MNSREYLRVYAVSLGLIFTGLTLVSTAQAQLSPLTSEELSLVEGQSTGVQLGLEMRINHVNAGTDTAGALTCSGNNLVYCRLGTQFNNLSNWLLFKGFNGYLNIQNVTLYGAALDALPWAGSTLNVAKQSALAISFTLPSVANVAAYNPVNPGTTPAPTTVHIRNWSYTVGIGVNPCYAASNCGAYTAASPTALQLTQMATQNQQTYLSLDGSNNPTPPVYQSTNAANPYYSNSSFDTGKEIGTLGVMMNGNLNIGGTLYVYAK